MAISIFHNGKEYISASRAGELVGYSGDYVSQLCRRGKVPAKLVGRTWYVELESLERHRQTRQLGKPRGFMNMASAFDGGLEFGSSVLIGESGIESVLEKAPVNFKYSRVAAETVPVLSRREVVKGTKKPWLQMVKDFSLTAIALIAVVVTGTSLAERSMPNLAYSIETRLERGTEKMLNENLRSILAMSSKAWEPLFGEDEESEKQLEIRLTQEEIRALLFGYNTPVK